MLHVTVGKTIVRLVMISFYVPSVPLGHVACWKLPCQGLYLLYTLPVIAKYELLSVCLLSSKNIQTIFFSEFSLILDEKSLGSSTLLSKLTDDLLNGFKKFGHSF